MSITDKAGFDAHWDRAVLRLVLPDVVSRNAANYADVQYEQLGALLSRRAHLLLALWDGSPASSGSVAPPARGGTAQVVHMRTHGENNLRGFCDSPLFVSAGSLLDLSSGGPILQIVTPQGKTGGVVAVSGQQAPRAGDCFLYPPSDAPNDALRRTVAPGAVFAALGQHWWPEEPDRVHRAQRDFAQIIRLNRQITKFRDVDWAVLEDQIGYLPQLPGQSGLAGELLDRLRWWQAAADTAAQCFQRRLLGWWRPGSPVSTRLYSGWLYAKRHWRLQPPGALLIFAAVVPVAVACFEIYAHLDQAWGLLVSLALLLLSVAYYYLRVASRTIARWPRRCGFRFSGGWRRRRSPPRTTICASRAANWAGSSLRCAARRCGRRRSHCRWRHQCPDWVQAVRERLIARRRAVVVRLRCRSQKSGMFQPLW
jgi:hypothetical protein